MNDVRGQLTRSDASLQLETEVLGGGLEPGTRLPSERELAHRFGVSRPLVREALRSLAEHGLVEISPGRGAFVRAASTTEAARPLGSHYRRQNITVDHLIEVREGIEPAAARFAATRATEPRIADRGEAVGRNAAAETVLERARWDLTIHRLVARMSHNPVIDAT